MQSELRHLWHCWIFLSWPGDLSSCACGDQNQMFLTGRRSIICSHLCSDKTNVFKETCGHLQPCLWRPKTCFTGRRVISSHVCGNRCIEGDLGTSPALFVEFNIGIWNQTRFFLKWFLCLNLSPEPENWVKANVKLQHKDTYSLNSSIGQNRYCLSFNWGILPKMQRQWTNCNSHTVKSQRLNSW